MKERINKSHMKIRVTIIDPQIHISVRDVKIASDNGYDPVVEIGQHCEFCPNSELKDCIIKDRTVVRQSVVHESTLH